MAVQACGCTATDKPKREAIPQDSRPDGESITHTIMIQSQLLDLAKQFPTVSVTVQATDLLSFRAAIVADTIERYKAECEARMKAENEEKLLSRIEVAEKFGISTKTVERWAKAGYLTPVQIGGIKKYRNSECRKIMEAKGRAKA